MASCADENLAEELGLLKAMYSEDELKIEEVGANTKLAVKLAPMTAGEEERQFLWCELQLHVQGGYPSEPPSIALGSSRGLSDASRAGLFAELGLRAEELRGEAALFALLECGRAALTALNSPQGECAICLGGLSDAAPEVLRLPCYHVFHRQCMVEYCQSEVSRGHCGRAQTDIGSRSLACPECRADILLTKHPELQILLAQIAAMDSESLPSDELLDEESHGHQVKELNCVVQKESARTKHHSAKVAVEGVFSRHEAFIRLHHLYQGSDEKEKPLLRLLKELGLDAVVYYGKPAMIHIQGDPKGVDSFTGAAKRRHITVTIDVAQRSQGPPMSSGVTGVAAKKGSLDSAALAEHLETRGLGETSFSIIGR